MTQLEKLEMAHFMRFLKKERILYKFINACHTQNRIVLLGGCEIMCGFKWSETKQGSKFWDNIEHQWSIEYHTFKKAHCLGY
jgi:hypothetical protein